MYVPNSMSEGWIGIGADDASSIVDAKDYVRANGFDNLAGEAEPSDVRYFAMLNDPFLTNSYASLSYDYWAATIGTAQTKYLVDHPDGGTFGMQGPLPSILVKQATLFFPITPNVSPIDAN